MRHKHGTLTIGYAALISRLINFSLLAAQIKNKNIPLHELIIQSWGDATLILPGDNASG